MFDLTLKKNDIIYFDRIGRRKKDEKIFLIVLSCMLIFNMSPKLTAASDNNMQEEILVDMKLEDVKRKIMDDNSIQYEETYSTVVELEDEVDKLEIRPFSSLENVEDNVYWTATVKITYKISGEYVQLTNVSGKWTQLRGTTTLSKRNVNYGQSYMASNSASGHKSPKKNSFSYDTGFKKGRYIYVKIYYRKLIIFLEILKCRQSLMFQGFPAFLVTEDVLISP